MRLDGRVAVVTGASRGVGRAVSLALARAGAAVALGARSLDDLRAVEVEIVAAGGRARAIPLDVSALDSVRAFEAEVTAKLGVTTIVVNNAAFFGPLGRTRDADPTLWARTLQVNSIGAFYVTHAFLPGMLEARWGRIVNVSSAAALYPPMPILSAYPASKLALNHFTRCLALELAGSGVTANAIHPGEVNTAMWGDIRSQADRVGPDGQFIRGVADRVQQGGGDPPEKAAALVLRLTGDDAAGINGEFLFIENGILPPPPTWSAAERT